MPINCWHLLGHSTVVTSSLFTGAALYISAVENPSRLSISSNSAMLAEWKHSYAHAAPIQAGLALISGASGLLLAYKTRNTNWLIGAGLMLFNWPYTIIWILPINNKLNDTRNEDANDTQTRPLIKQWSCLHTVRTLLGAAAIGAYIYTLHKH